MCYFQHTIAGLDGKQFMFFFVFVLPYLFDQSHDRNAETIISSAWPFLEIFGSVDDHYHNFTSIWASNDRPCSYILTATDRLIYGFAHFFHPLKAL